MDYWLSFYIFVQAVICWLKPALNCSVMFYLISFPVIQQKQLSFILKVMNWIAEARHSFKQTYFLWFLLIQKWIVNWLRCVYSHKIYEQKLVGKGRNKKSGEPNQTQQELRSQCSSQEGSEVGWVRWYTKKHSNKLAWQTHLMFFSSLLFFVKAEHINKATNWTTLFPCPNIHCRSKVSSKKELRERGRERFLFGLSQNFIHLRGQSSFGK